MYLEMLYNRYGSVLEKQATAITNRPTPWKPRNGAGSPWYVRKVTSPTGTVERYYGDSKGDNYYKNMKPSNPGYSYAYDDYFPENSPYTKNLNKMFDNTRAGKEHSDEELRMFNEWLSMRNRLKKRLVPRYTYIPK